jgi:hypothetical protein
MMEKSEKSTPSTQAGHGKQGKGAPGRGSELIEDYVTGKTFRKGLENLNFINEEYITKLKIIAMGQILANGIMDRI